MCVCECVCEIYVCMERAYIIIEIEEKRARGRMFCEGLRELRRGVIIKGKKEKCVKLER